MFERGVVRINAMKDHKQSYRSWFRSLIQGFVTRAYWQIVRDSVTRWGGKGLHATKIGSFVAGDSGHQRSFLREQMLLKSLPLFVEFSNSSVLDLGCNDGFWSFRFGSFGISTLRGIDASGVAVDRALFLRDAHNYTEFCFEQGEISDVLRREIERSERYDVVLLLSLIYHLPASTDWAELFGMISEVGRGPLIIDTRWFDNEDYWHKTTYTPDKLSKWRPHRKEVFSYLRNCGYVQILEIDPTVFLSDPDVAFGDGDPYSLDNVADYVTHNRSVVVANRQARALPRCVSDSCFSDVTDNV